MTDTSAPPFAAQLILSLPGRADSATITVTLLPNDTIKVDGQKKILADCTLGDLRAFANTLEAEVWQTYDEISLLDMSTAKDVAVVLTRLSEDGGQVVEMEDWPSSIIVLPAVTVKPKAPAGKSADEPSVEKGKTAAAKITSPDDQAAEDAAGEVKAKPQAKQPAPKPPKAEAEAEPKSEPPVEKPAPPAAKPVVVDDVAAAISFPPPVKPSDVEKARPKATERPHVPATIEPSEARVRVAGKRLAPGNATWAAVDILMDEPPLRAMQAHALSSLDREVAGVMVGPRPEKQPDGRYLVRIIDSIAAKYTVMQGASVTYTADSWRYLNDTIGERYPHETGVMVGWYHTHPGFGIFLSGMDLFIHQNFFTQIWHTAYVLDPRARTSGFFCWSRDKSRVNRNDFVWPEWADGSW